MKKIFAILIAALLLFGTVSAFALEQPLDKAYIYVSAGAKNGDGSKDNPFGTFEEARDKIRVMKSNGQYPQSGVVVYFREGNYSINESMKLTDEDSGTAEGPVVYRSYMEEQVSFVGGVELSMSDFSPVSDPTTVGRLNTSAADKIRCVNLKNMGITEYGNINMIGYCTVYFTSPNTGLLDYPYYEQPPEVFFGDEVGILARYPNDDYLLTGAIRQSGDDIQNWSHVYEKTDTYIPPEQREYPPKPSIYEVDESTKKRMQNWQSENDPWVYGYFSENWADGSLPVREFDSKNGTVTTELPSAKPIKSNMNYYVYNMLSEIDMPGEYFLDRETGILYVYPKDANGKITFSNLNDPIVLAEGARNIKFKALKFMGTRKTAIRINGCDNVDLELCVVSKAAARAIIATNCMNCDFISCHCYQTGTGGIYVNTDKDTYGSEIYEDVDNNLTPQNNTIENCELHDFSRISATYSPAVFFSGAGNVLRNSKIWSGTHYAIEYKGNDCIIENCEFTDLLRTADDSGVIYANFNKERRGLVVRNNYFHDIYSTSTKGSDITCIYPDDTYSGLIAYQNLVVNVGGRFIQSNGGADHEITNNIAINLGNKFMSLGNNEFGFDSGSEAGKYNWERYSFQKYLNNPAYAKYKNFATITQENYRQVRDVVTDNNVIWNVPIDIDSKAVPEWNQINPSLNIDSDPGFVDMENGDYTLKPDSAIYKTYEDFKAPDFKKMGMYTGKLKSLLGSDIALLVGSPKAYKDFVAVEINADHTAVPIMNDGMTYVPIRFITETLGGEVSYDEETRNVIVSYDSTVTVTPDEYINKNGTTYLSAERAQEVFGKVIKTFDNGVVIIGDEVKISTQDSDLLSEIYRRLSNE